MQTMEYGLKQRSTIGYVCIVGGIVVSWISILQCSENPVDMFMIYKLKFTTSVGLQT